MNAIIPVLTAILAPHAVAAEVHWSLTPVQKPVPPAVFSETARNPVDLFVAAKLAHAGLSPSPEADPRTLVRRLSYTLTGLPPALADVAAFARDPQKNYPNLVERLLASDSYGEAWARHWLDVVGFAETHGFEMNQPRNNAWVYRDYVIRAFNEDLPYDRFVREQIAGDVLQSDAATGLLVAGAWDQVKSPDPVLTANQRADELHAIVSTVSSTFLALTVGCARCHDHKFDPISQLDYHRIKAVFAGVQHGERERNDPDAAPVRRRIADLQTNLAELERALDAAEPIAEPHSTNALRRAVNARRNVERFPFLRASAVRFTIFKTSSLEPCIDELEVLSPAGENVALAAKGTQASASGTYAGSDFHKLDHIHDGRYGNGRSWISDQQGAGWVQLDFPAPLEIEQIVWGRDREQKFGDRLPLEYKIEARLGDREWQLLASSSDRARGGAEPQNDSQTKLLARQKEALGEIARLQRGLSVYAGRFDPSPEPTRRLQRGDPMQPREVVAPGPLSVFGTPFRDDCGTGLTEDQTRRLAFANWLLDRNNPLVARVIVNRIWQYHFGQGLVATPSDFGLNGARPSHPDLLDWLAAELIDSGWSIKHIQRLIVMSATFRQASAYRDDCAAADADARLLWRFPPRRLDAEAIRDSVLTASAAFDERPGGAGFSFFEPNDNYVRVYTPREAWPKETFRRMIYGTVVRQRPDGVFGVFDCPDAGQIAPRRTTSTTPLQALNLLNSSFLLQQAHLFAERLERESPADARVARAFEIAFQRKPGLNELNAAEALARDEGLSALCRALFNANEFVFLF